MEPKPALEYLSRLSASEREELEAKAMMHARRLAVEGYERATAAGNVEVAAHYRQVILDQYLRDVLGTHGEAASGRVTQESV